jgi:hypothetical protein
MATINNLMREFEKSASTVIKELNQYPKDDSRSNDVIEFKSKIQNLIADWYSLLEKWAKGEDYWQSENFN